MKLIDRIKIVFRPALIVAFMLIIAAVVVALITFTVLGIIQVFGGG